MNTHTREMAATLDSGIAKSELFRTADGRNLVVTFVLITSLFLLWTRRRAWTLRQVIV
jgi:hypothetical protein